MRYFVSILVVLLTGYLAAVIFDHSSIIFQPKIVSGHVTYGATFSPTYARFLGLDSQQALTDILTDLPIRELRVPLHWDEVQPVFGVTDFTELDVIMTLALQHEVGVVLAIGNKVPRWPECHAPAWAQALNDTDYAEALLDYIELIVNRYGAHPALERWQVENEVLFNFGDCPALDYRLVREEIAKVRELDDQHPIQLTVSGEQQLWVALARDADVLGASLYRQVVLPTGWRFTFPIPPLWYTLQAISVSLFVDQVVISELQVEPWLAKDYREYTPVQAAALFTPSQLEAYLGYAQRTRIDNVSLWGVEWWYYLKQNGQPELWEAGKVFLK